MTIFKCVVLLLGINFSVNALAFDKKERQGIAETPTVKMVADPNWLSFEVIDNKGHYIRMVAQYVNFISLKSGLTLKVAPAKTWNESINFMKPGQIDLISATNDSALSDIAKKNDKWYKHKLITTADSTFYYRVIATILTVTFLVLVWVLILFRKIQKYKKVEKKWLKSSKLLIQQQKELESYKSLTPLSYIEWDNEFRVIEWNKSSERVFGFKRAEALGKKAIELLIHPDEKVDIDAIWQRTKENTNNVENVYRNVDKLGVELLCRWHNTPLHDEKGHLLKVISVSFDVTAYENAKQQLMFLAYHDELTGLPTRRLGKDRLEQAIASIKRNKLSLAVMYVDLDGFKLINDNFGHDAGDLVIKVVGQRIVDILRNTDTVARQGGDEFMLVLTDIKDIGAIIRVAANIVKTIAEEIIYKNKRLIVGASVGVTICNGLSVDSDKLMKEADIAMYAAKKLGKGTFVFYHPSLLDHES
jgi:diguanylate cyclase (GGDEF)-like protein/PAS domain S-box-containing protein